MKELIFILQGYDSEDPLGNMANVTTVELMDTTVEKALMRAKKMINKKYWRVSTIVEKQNNVKNKSG